jgi:hypothetical protein
MKKVLLPAFTFLLVFGMLFTSFGSVNAADVNDPVVTPVSGDMEFFTSVVPIASLPGAAKLARGLLVPVGFPEGEAQFGSNGVKVTDFTSGKAATCFSITGVEYGWGGKVGMWDGSKWVLLPTTITSYKESLVSSACATITSNGTYTFIRWVADATLLPTSKPQCDLNSLAISGDEVTGGVAYDSLYGNLSTADSWMTYEIRDASSGITGDFSGNTITEGDGDFDFSPIDLFVPYGGTYTIHFETPHCYYDWDLFVFPLFDL